MLFSCCSLFSWLGSSLDLDKLHFFANNLAKELDLVSQRVGNSCLEIIEYHHLVPSAYVEE